MNARSSRWAGMFFCMTCRPSVHTLGSREMVFTFSLVSDPRPRDCSSFSHDTPVLTILTHAQASSMVITRASKCGVERGAPQKPVYRILRKVGCTLV